MREWQHCIKSQDSTKQTRKYRLFWRLDHPYSTVLTPTNCATVIPIYKTEYKTYEQIANLFIEQIPNFLCA